MSNLKNTIQKQYEQAVKRVTQLNEARKIINRLPKELRDVEFDYISIGVYSNGSTRSWRDIDMNIQIDASYFSSDNALSLRDWMNDNTMVAWDSKVEYQGYGNKFMQKGVLHNCGHDIGVQIDSLPKPDDCEIIEKEITVTTYEVVCNKE